MARLRKKPVTKKDTNTRSQLPSELIQDILAIALFALGIFIAFCLWLAPSSSERNLLGALGLWIYNISQFLFGQGKWFPAAALVLLGTGGWLKAGRPGKVLYLAYALITASGCAIMHLQLPEEQQFFSFGIQGVGGGAVGGALLQGSNLLLGKTGSWILYIALVAVSVLIITGKTIRELAGDARGKAKVLAQTAHDGISRLSGRGDDRKSRRSPNVFDSLNLPTDTELRRDKQGYVINGGISPSAVSERHGLAASDDKAGSLEETEGRWAEKNRNRTEKNGSRIEKEGNQTENTTSANGRRAMRQGSAKNGQHGEEDSLPPPKDKETWQSKGGKDQVRTYKLPLINLLQPSPKLIGQRQNKVIADNVRILEKTLDDFGVKAEVTQVNRGPSVTRYELQPAPGVKVSRITGLSDDIALALAASQIRIEAPIPGKAAIGIEVPNEERAMVSLREILEDPVFKKAKAKLTFALGKDVAGKPIVADLAKMPHLLIAGSTGSGKSVCINTIIVSILFSSTPDEVKMMMVDPKMVELTVYNDIPHLIYPVVTEPKKAAKALRWAVHEMERRYDTFAKAGVRDISSYNTWLAQQEDEGKPLPIPYIVIIIDELSDLMLVAPADVEDSINRLAAMSRAAGMHLVIATQRPSVNVITGVIKANIPSRIAFAVSSQTDSRVILDMAGAEKLLGKGDMLYYTLENPKPVRVQGVYVGDEEIENVTDFIKSENVEPDYLEDVVPDTDEEEKEDSGEIDALLKDAARLFIQSGQASVSLLQRRMRVGYARAGRIIDQMETLGVIGGYEGSKPRAILMTLEQFEERYGKA
ncbi:MAG: DNA translocase FtsK [Peptococcaceae bacterium]|jgi:S-DNA-T family DNA segregation ATPase FtsK/SpoIIIE|nr:DNA translocase FtsK [Peptococcaceae bacterium]